MSNESKKNAIDILGVQKLNVLEQSTINGGAVQIKHEHHHDDSYGHHHHKDTMI